MENSHLSTKQKQLKSVALTLDQYRATELLAIGKSDKEVAQLVGVETTTIEQWQQKPEFAAVLNMLRVASSDSSVTTEEIEKVEPITTLIDVARFL